MLVVARDLRQVFTSDVNSDAISILERDKDADVSGWKRDTHPGRQGARGL